MNRTELQNHIYDLTATEEKRKKSKTEIPSNFYAYMDSIGMVNENGIYILPDSHFKPPYKSDDTSIWDKFDNSKCQEILRIKKASRFYKEPFAYADFVGIRYVYSGNVQLNTPTSSFMLCQNDVCLLNGGFIFSQYLPHDEDIVFTLFFDKEYLLRNVLKDTTVNSVITRFILNFIMDSPNPQNYILFHGKNNDRLQNIMEILLCEYLDPSEYSLALIESYIRIFLLEIFCCPFEYTKTSEGKQSLQIAQILDYIDKNFSTVTLDLLAEKFGYNSKYLSRLIKNYTEKNFKDLVVEKRMEHASLLLLNSDLTVHSIIEKCGLCNETYFYRCFYDKYHMTPNEYRNGGYSVLST